MTALNTLSTPRADLGDRAYPAIRPEELIAAADWFGQMTLSDQGGGIGNINSMGS